MIIANAALVECADPTTLDEILSSGLDGFVVQRISDTCVLVDHERLDDLLRLLKRQGQTPRITQE